MIEFEAFIEQLLGGYRSSYDIEKVNNPEDELYATAHMHMEQYQKLLFKEFKTSQSDADEYVYFYRTPHLTAKKAQELIQRSYDDGFPRIKLEHVTFRHQHMCTRLVAIVICDEADEEALKVIKKSKIYKSFQFSLKGWMEVHTAVLELGTGEVVGNSYGRETAKFMKKHVEHYLKQHVDK